MHLFTTYNISFIVIKEISSKFHVIKHIIWIISVKIHEAEFAVLQINTFHEVWHVHGVKAINFFIATK